LKNLFFKLPLYSDDKKSIQKLDQNQQIAVKDFAKKIEINTYNYIDNRCLCGNVDKSLDILLSEKDRYGISIKFLLCKKCSLIRTDKKLDEPSLSSFYSTDYRKIYGNDLLSIEDEYNGQVQKGEYYKRLLQKHISLTNITTVLDVGCGTGGVLYPFMQIGKKVTGSDFNIDRLNFGRSRGLHLLHADKDSAAITETKYDLIILSHVMEHYSDPILEVNNLFELLTDNGYILIIVPSPLNIGNSPHITHRFFQNIHLYNFNKKYLTGFFKKLGMDVIYIDEVCHCILKKPNNWHRNNIICYEDSSLEEYYREILNHLKKVVLLNDLLKIGIAYKQIQILGIKVLGFLRIKNFVKRIIRGNNG